MCSPASSLSLLTVEEGIVDVPTVDDVAVDASIMDDSAVDK